MTQYHAPVDEVESLLNNVLDYRAHYQSLGVEFDIAPEDVATIVAEVAKFADAELAPLNKVGDKSPAQLIDGQVKTPEGFKESYRTFVEAGWPRLAQQQQHGGILAPFSLKFIISEFLQGANQAWCMYSTLNDGAIKVLQHFGNDHLQESYLPKLISGEWLATMCLTEPQCGSDLNLLNAKAEPRDDGSYAISGNKIFISSGKHDLSDNIVHLVLARLPDAPPGTAGISLFLVPAQLEDDNGGMRDNAIDCLSVESKMGLKGSATCALSFNAAKGWLIGKPHRGLRAMFVFINKSRLSVAQQAQAQTQAAFQASLHYAQERVAGKPAASASTSATAIVHHPNIQHMLLFQQAISTAARGLLTWLAMQADLVDYGNPDQQQLGAARLSLLTPVAKGFGSEIAFEAIDHGIQIFGGHGYTADYELEQRLRDVRITRIYEGTSAIQALDLLQRKVSGPDYDTLQAFCQLILDWCRNRESKCSEGTKEMLALLERQVSNWLAVSDLLVQHSQENRPLLETAANDYMMMSGYIVYGYFLLQHWHHTGEEESTSIAACVRYYFDRVLPRADYHHALLKDAKRHEYNIAWSDH